jgi:hypothetical protein
MYRFLEDYWKGNRLNPRKYQYRWRGATNSTLIDREMGDSMQVITRRQFLKTTIGISCLSAFPLCAAASDAADRRFQGCFLQAASDNFLDKINFLLSSNDKEVDQICAGAERDLRREFRVSPHTWFYDDGTQPNAFATWFLRSGFKGDGTVCLGIGFIKQATRRNELNRQWKTRLTGIIAHEWAHIAQFNRGHRTPGKATELHADFLAGWFLGRTSLARPGATDQQRTDSMYRFGVMGDFEYSNPHHHGTPGERAGAITSGFDLAAKVDNIDAAFRARSLKG